MNKAGLHLKRFPWLSCSFLGLSRRQLSIQPRTSTRFLVCLDQLEGRFNVRHCSNKNIVKPFFDDVDIPTNKHFLQFLWEGAVKNHGDKIAFADDIIGREYTYKEAYAASRQFGSAVKRIGLHKKEVVAFFLHNCPEYITCLTGVIGVGGVATTVNPNYTATEVTRQLEMADVKMIVTTSDLVLVAKEAVQTTKRNIDIIVLDSKVTNTLFYDDVMQRDELYPDHNNTEFSKDDVLILPYSSGTTGLPKGMRRPIKITFHITCENMCSCFFDNITKFNFRSNVNK